MKAFSKKWIAVAAGLALSSVSALASHLPGVSFGPQNFNVDPTAVGEAFPPFVAGSINFSVRSLINQAGTVFTEHGQIGFLTFFSNGVGSPALGVGTTGLNVPSTGGPADPGYRLYALFQGSGTTVLANSTIEGTFFTFLTQIFVDKNNDTVFNATGSQLPTIPVASYVDDVLVLTGDLQVGGFHLAGGPAKGDFDVIFNVTGFGPPGIGGKSFFSTTVDGMPLKQGRYTSVNSTLIGIVPPPASFVDGEVDGGSNLVFGAQAPEPTSLALVGIALAGGALARRKAQA